MKQTIIRERIRVELKNPILIEGLPGLGMVGRIATKYLIKKLGAKPFALLYSPHFPYYVLVNRKGRVRLLRGVFYYWINPKNDGNDLMFFTGDSQAQTIEGQYEVASKIVDFAKSKGASLIVTLGGFRAEIEDVPKVYAASNNDEWLEKALKASAIKSPSGNPIVGVAGLILGIARFKGVNALCLLGETKGYLPDPRASKSVLESLCKILDLNVDLSGLDAQIRKAEQIIEKMRQIEEKREIYLKKIHKEEKERTSYIS